MIQIVKNASKEALIDAVTSMGIYGTKIYSMCKCYPIESGILDIWILKSGGAVKASPDFRGFDSMGIDAVAARLSGGLTVAARENTDVDELASFIQIVGGKFIEGDETLLNSMNRLINGDIFTGWIMSFSSDARYSHNNNQNYIIRTSPILGDIYSLICGALPSFSQEAEYGAWLTEVSHRVRHKLSTVYELNVENNCVSTASIYFQDEKTAILNFIATDPVYQGHGYGTSLLIKVTQEALNNGKNPYVIVASDDLTPFYESCGYRKIGRWAKIRL